MFPAISCKIISKDYTNQGGGLLQELVISTSQMLKWPKLTWELSLYPTRRGTRSISPRSPAASVFDQVNSTSSSKANLSKSAWMKPWSDRGKFAKLHLWNPLFPTAPVNYHKGNDVKYSFLSLFLPIGTTASTNKATAMSIHRTNSYHWHCERQQAFN